MQRRRAIGEPGTPSLNEPPQQPLMQALAELETAARHAKPEEREAIMERLIHRVEFFFREHHASEHAQWASASLWLALNPALL